MFLLGILSFLQITLIPGVILLHVFKIKVNSLIQNYLYIFTLSLFTNYSLVTILTILKLYTIISIVIVIAIEIVCLIILVNNGRVNPIPKFRFSVAFQKYLALYKYSSLHIKIIIVSVSVLLLFYFALFISNLGTIFYFVDTVNLIHWNTWAKDFANNMLPIKSSHFPQLIPANWSIAYVLTGNSYINFFAKSFMPLFFLGNLLIFVDLAIWKKNYIYLIALIIYGLFAPIIYPLVFIADGNADLAVSFFTFLAFYAFIRLSKDEFITDERLLFFLFAAIAATTKLAGFYVFLIASIISLYGLIKYWKHIERSKIILIFTLVPLILAICLFWHLLKPTVMVSGLHQPEYVGENYILIFIKAVKLMYYLWGLPVLAFFILTLMGSLFVKNVRYVTLIMVIPPLILWMLKYSSDFRNLSFVIPYIAFVSAFGLIKIIEIIRNKTTNPHITIAEHNEAYLSNKQKMIGGLISVLCVGLFFLFETDFFYSLLLQTHKFISIYYFQSHRINLLIDYTQYASIDYYQAVLATSVIIIPFLYVITITNMRFYHLLIIGVITVFILNFTSLRAENIIDCQHKLTEQVEARNYADWMDTIVESSGFEKQVYTNFNSISTEKIPGELEFIFLNESELENRLFCKTCRYLLFLKTVLLNNELKSKIDSEISKSNFEVLFDDGDFMLLNIRLK
jgi:hypothetical protein